MGLRPPQRCTIGGSDRISSARATLARGKANTVNRLSSTAPDMTARIIEGAAPRTSSAPGAAQRASKPLARHVARERLPRRYGRIALQTSDAYGYAALMRPAASRLRTAFMLFDAGYELMQQNLRRRYPDETEEQVHRRLVEWLQNSGGERPGAPYTFRFPS